MATRGPGANSRGRGGKFKKFTRGGTHHSPAPSPIPHPNPQNKTDAPQEASPSLAT
ncbi:hypothetical protein IMZ48_42690 [Candidatus Bathyarchaeota archaeon]|nr:hypothetical protein [Candidatus Bathyarchaeota archaeon]